MGEEVRFRCVKLGSILQATPWAMTCPCGSHRLHAIVLKLNDEIHSSPPPPRSFLFTHFIFRLINPHLFLVFLSCTLYNYFPHSLLSAILFTYHLFSHTIFMALFLFRFAISFISVHFGLSISLRFFLLLFALLSHFIFLLFTDFYIFHFVITFMLLLF